MQLSIRLRWQRMSVFERRHVLWPRHSAERWHMHLQHGFLRDKLRTVQQRAELLWREFDRLCDAVLMLVAFA